MIPQLNEINSNKLFNHIHIIFFLSHMTSKKKKKKNTMANKVTTNK